MPFLSNAFLAVAWPMTSSDLEWSRSWPQYAHYLENGWRCRLEYNGAPTGNGT